jgi:polysaccharide pyruvyl transferase WcaK-like protein
MRVLVCSSGGVRNLGDDAILLRTAERIRARFRRARIDALTDEPGPIPGFPALQRIGRNRDADRIEYESYGLVVIAGGGFACDRFGSHVTARRAIAEHAAAAGVPVVVTGHGVGPLQDATVGNDLRALARIANGFSVRDECSRELLDSFGVSAVVTGDDALGLEGYRGRPPRHPYVVVHLRDASYHTTDPDDRRAWVDAALKLAETHGWRVVGLAVNDRAEAPEHATLRAAGIDRVVDATHDARLAVSTAARAAGVVSHSYHLALFALANGVPAVLTTASPYYAQKGEGLRRLALLSDAMLAPQPSDAQELGDRLDEVRSGLHENEALARAAAQVDAFFNEQCDRVRPGSEPRRHPDARDTP